MEKTQVTNFVWDWLELKTSCTRILYQDYDTIDSQTLVTWLWKVNSAQGVEKVVFKNLQLFRTTLIQTITLHIHAQYYIKTITMAIPQWDQRWTANTISTDGSSFHLSIKSNLHLLWFCLTTLEAIGIKIFRYSLNQSEVKPDPIITCSHVFLYFIPATSLGLEFWLVHCIVYVHCTSLTLVISLVLILQLSSDSHSY